VAATALPLRSSPAFERRDRGSAAHQLLQMFRVAGSLDSDLGDGAVDVAQILARQFDVSRFDVFLQPVQLRGAGDRRDPRLLGQQPGDRDLSRRQLFLGRDFAEQINKSLVCLTSLRREAGNDVAEVGAVEGRVLADGAREETLAQRGYDGRSDRAFASSLSCRTILVALRISASLRVTPMAEAIPRNRAFRSR
jgi:hypothetical protein